MDYNKLWATLCKYWQPITKDYFWKNMDQIDMINAVGFIPKQIFDEQILIRDRRAFEVYNK